MNPMNIGEELPNRTEDNAIQRVAQEALSLASINTKNTTALCFLSIHGGIYILGYLVW